MQFEMAPLSEVIYSVYFSTKSFPSTAFGRYQDSISKRFPVEAREETPLHISLDETNTNDFAEESQLPPLRRVIFETVGKSELIQLQQDAFFFNWRRKSDDDKYSNFQTIFPRFLEEYHEFVAWFKSNLGESVTPKRYGLTYINFIGAKDDWKSPKDHPKIFTFVGKGWGNGLVEPEDQGSYLRFSAPLGRVLVVLRPGSLAETPEKERGLSFELWAGSKTADAPIEDWFRQAHDFIDLAFRELTTPEAKKGWKPIEK